MPKHPYYDQSRREFWRITNMTSKRNINIGDLPQLPTLAPNERCDLLRYYTKEEVNQSEVLPFLIKKGWIRAKKNLDKTDTNIYALSSFIATGIITITEDMRAGLEQIILCDATSGQITVTLPPAGSSIRMYYVKKIDTSGNKVVITGTSNEQIDNYDCIDITVSNNCIKIVSNGTAWWVI